MTLVQCRKDVGIRWKRGWHNVGSMSEDIGTYGRIGVGITLVRVGLMSFCHCRANVGPPARKPLAQHHLGDVGPT